MFSNTYAVYCPGEEILPNIHRIIIVIINIAVRVNRVTNVNFRFNAHSILHKAATPFDPDNWFLGKASIFGYGYHTLL